MTDVRKHKSLLATIFIVASLLTFSVSAYYQGVSMGAQLAPNIVAPVVAGSADFSNPGHESFWAGVAGDQIPLTRTNDFGGATNSVTVKMVNNGTHILVLATWSDPTRSIKKNNVIENESFPGLFYANSSFYYEDRIVFWWSLDNSVGPPPCMQKSAYGHGEGESLAGTGNLWHWKAARTDSGGTSFAKLKYGSGPFAGKALLPPHSYADNEFINSTGHYQLGYDQYPTKTVPGNFTIGYGANNVPYDTFMVWAHGVYDSTTHTYSWEAARTLTTAPTTRIVQFHQSQTFYFAVAVYDGGPIPIPSGVSHPAGWTSYGENEETKSISSWNTMALGAPISGTPGVVTQVTTEVSTVAGQPAEGGISFSTAALMSLALLAVGFVAGMGLIYKFGTPKRS